MNHLKAISIFLVVVFLLQLLPVKQAVRYFYIDNAMAEEIVHDVKEPGKDSSFFTFDDQLTHGLFTGFHPCIVELPHNGSAHTAHFTSCQAAEIDTPPPNKA